MSDEVKVTLDPSIGHPDDATVTEWRLEYRPPKKGELACSQTAGWVKIHQDFSGLWLVAIPVSRKSAPKFKVGDDVLYGLPGGEKHAGFPCQTETGQNEDRWRQ